MTACKTKSGGCSDQDKMAILTKYREVSNQNIAQVQACITSGDVSCVQKLEAQAAPAGAIDAAIPLGYGAQSRELMARQNNVITFGSVKGGASLFGTDAQQAKEVADFRNANCSSLSASACNTLVNQALDDRMTRAGILMAAGALTPVAVNGLRTLSVPKAGASTETLSSGKPSATAKARIDNNANAENARDPFNIQSPENNAASKNLTNKAVTDAAAGTYNPHYDPKHGPGTTLQQQYDRAMAGTNPQTGTVARPADASKFFNATDMDTAIKQAEAAYAANPAANIDPKTGRVDINISFNRPIGEGYTGNTKTNKDAGVAGGEYRWSNTATVGIDPKTGKAYTAYPNVIQGVPKPDPLKNGVIR